MTSQDNQQQIAEKLRFFNIGSDDFDRFPVWPMRSKSTRRPRWTSFTAKSLQRPKQLRSSNHAR